MSNNTFNNDQANASTPRSDDVTTQADNMIEDILSEIEGGSQPQVPPTDQFQGMALEEQHLAPRGPPGLALPSQPHHWQQYAQQPVDQQAFVPQAPQQVPEAGTFASMHMNVEMASVALCRRYVAEIDALSRAWLQVELSAPRDPAQVAAALAQVSAAQQALAERRALWSIQFPHNAELTGNPVPTSTPSVSPSSVVAPVVTQKDFPVPENLPYLDVPGSKNSDPRSKAVYPSANAWACAFEDALKVKGISIDIHWERLLLQSLDRAQREQVNNELQEPEYRNLTHNWPLVRRVILKLFDTAIQKRKFIRKVLLCTQGANESLERYVSRFQKAVHTAELPVDDPILLDLFLMNMTPASRFAAESWLTQTHGNDWPANLLRVFKHIAALPTSPSKRPRNDDDEAADDDHQQPRRTRPNNKGKAVAGKRQQKKEFTNWCRHCLKHGEKVSFSFDHECPYSGASSSKSKPAPRPQKKDVTNQQWRDYSRVSRRATRGAVLRIHGAAEETARRQGQGQSRDQRQGQQSRRETANEEAGAPTLSSEDDDEEMEEASSSCRSPCKK